MDFGLEVLFPWFIDVPSKRIHLQFFLWLCQLSDIMRSIVVLSRAIREYQYLEIDTSNLEAVMEKGNGIKEGGKKS